MRLAIDVLGGLDRSTVAAQVKDALESVSTGVVAAISGTQRGGYVEPHEALGMLLETSIERFVQRLSTLAEAGNRDIAAEIGTGILDGLKQADGNDEAAISFDEQFIEMYVSHV